MTEKVLASANLRNRKRCLDSTRVGAAKMGSSIDLAISWRTALSLAPWDGCRQEVAATDAGMQARDQVAVNDDVILLSTANGDTGGPLIHHQLSVIEPKPQTHGAR